MAATQVQLETIQYVINATPTFTNFVLSSATSRMAVTFSSAVTGTITALGFRYGARTGTPPTYRISLQGVSASGLPDGVILSGSDATFTPPASAAWDSTWQWITVSGANVTRGSYYALVIDYSAGTTDGSNNGSFSYAFGSGVQPTNHVFPGIYTDTTGSGWTAQPNTPRAFLGYRTASATYGNPCQASSTYNLNSDGNRIANKFSLSASIGSTYQIDRILSPCMAFAAGGSFRFGVWNAAGTALSYADFDTDLATQSNSNRQAGWIALATVATLNFGTTYYIGVERLSASNAQARTIDFGATSDLSAFPFGSAGCVSTWDGSAWTDVSTSIMPITFAISDWTIPAANDGSWLGNPSRQRRYERRVVVPKRTVVLIPGGVINTTSYVPITPRPRLVNRLVRVREPVRPLILSSVVTNTTVLVATRRVVR